MIAAIFVGSAVSSENYIPLNCPSETNQASLNLLKDVLDTPDGDRIRNQMGLNSTSFNEVQTLINPNDTSACSQLANNADVKAALDRRHSNGAIVYKAYYYRADNFYFVIMQYQQSGIDGDLTLAPTYLDIFNNNFVRLKGYSL